MQNSFTTVENLILCYKYSKPRTVIAAQCARPPSYVIYTNILCTSIPSYNNAYVHPGWTRIPLLRRTRLADPARLPRLPLVPPRRRLQLYLEPSSRPFSIISRQWTRYTVVKEEEISFTFIYGVSTASPPPAHLYIPALHPQVPLPVVRWWGLSRYALRSRE